MDNTCKYRDEINALLNKDKDEEGKPKKPRKLKFNEIFITKNTKKNKNNNNKSNNKKNYKK